MNCPHCGKQINKTMNTCEYENDGSRITAAGKFEGEPVFAPYFWGLALDGCADFEDGRTSGFRFNFSNNQALADEWPTLKPWLGRSRTLRLHEDEQGFVHCR